MMCPSGLSIHFDRHCKCSENIQLLCLSSPGPMQTRQLIQAKQVSRRTHAQINTPAPAAFNTRRKVVLASKPTKLPCVLAKPNSSDDVSFRPIDPFRSPWQMLGKYSAFMSVITRTHANTPTHSSKASKSPYTCANKHTRTSCFQHTAQSRASKQAHKVAMRSRQAQLKWWCVLQAYRSISIAMANARKIFSFYVCHHQDPCKHANSFKQSK